MSNSPTLAPPSYASLPAFPRSRNDNESSESFELPSYPDAALFPHYHTDVKSPGIYESKNDDNANNDTNDSNGQIDPEIQAITLLIDYSNARKARQLRKNEARKRGCLYYLKPSTAHSAVENAGGQGKRAAASMWKSTCKVVALTIYVLLWVIYFGLFLGIPVILICSWAGVKFGGSGNKDKDS